MKKILTLIMASAVIGSSANAVLVSSQNSSLSTENSQHSATSANLKVVIKEAKEDAQAFVISDGQVRGTALQRALNMIRAQDANLSGSDMDLAKAILAE